MNVIDRIKQIDKVDSVYWDWINNKLTIYHHGDREATKVKVAYVLRQDDVIDSIDNILLIS